MRSPPRSPLVGDRELLDSTGAGVSPLGTRPQTTKEFRLAQSAAAARVDTPIMVDVRELERRSVRRVRSKSRPARCQGAIWLKPSGKRIDVVHHALAAGSVMVEKSGASQTNARSICTPSSVTRFPPAACSLLDRRSNSPIESGSRSAEANSTAFIMALSTPFPVNGGDKAPASVRPGVQCRYGAAQRRLQGVDFRALRAESEPQMLQVRRGSHRPTSRRAGGTQTRALSPSAPCADTRTLYVANAAFLHGPYCHAMRRSPASSTIRIRRPSTSISPRCRKSWRTMLTVSRARPTRLPRSL